MCICGWGLSNAELRFLLQRVSKRGPLHVFWTRARNLRTSLRAIVGRTPSSGEADERLHNPQRNEPARSSRPLFGHELSPLLRQNRF